MRLQKAFKYCQIFSYQRGRITSPILVTQHFFTRVPEKIFLTLKLKKRFDHEGTAHIGTKTNHYEWKLTIWLKYLHTDVSFKIFLISVPVPKSFRACKRTIYIQGRRAIRISGVVLSPAHRINPNISLET